MDFIAADGDQLLDQHVVDHASQRKAVVEFEAAHSILGIAATLSVDADRAVADVIQSRLDLADARGGLGRID